MSRTVRCGLIQAGYVLSSDRSLPQIKKAMIDKHLKLIERAAKQKVKILCLQELFYGPYFCAEQNIRWYELTERVPEGPTTKLMQKLAAKHRMAIVVPVYEEQMPGMYFNTAAVIDARRRRRRARRRRKRGDAQLLFRLREGAARLAAIAANVRTGRTPRGRARLDSSADGTIDGAADRLRAGAHPAITVVRSFSGESIMLSFSKLLPVPRIVTLP